MTETKPCDLLNEYKLISIEWHSSSAILDVEGVKEEGVLGVMDAIICPCGCV